MARKIENINRLILTIAAPTCDVPSGGKVPLRMQVSMRSNRTQLEGNKMIRSTRGLRAVLGLCVLALGVFGASSAQASVWMVGGTNLTSGTKPLSASIVKTGVLHTKIGGNKVEFTCPEGQLVNVSLEASGKLTRGGKVEFTKCTTIINGTVNPACEPVTEGTAGRILSNEGEGQLTLHSTGDGVTVIKSILEEVVAGVKQPVFGRIKSSVECPIGSNIPIIGPKLSVQESITTAEKEAGKTPNSSLEEEKATHNIVEFAPLTEIWALSKTEEHKASVLGEAAVKITAGGNWNGLRE
jgi:hypothetical protein